MQVQQNAVQVNCISGHIGYSKQVHCKKFNFRLLLSTIVIGPKSLSAKNYFEKYNPDIIDFIKIWLYMCHTFYYYNFK